MKHAKEQFDKLIARARKGHSVHFGEVEQIFADAFLERYLQQLEKRAQHTDATESDADGDLDDEYDERPEIPEEVRIRQELDNTRTVIGTLGVRPSTAAMSRYTQYAVTARDWELLNVVLGLTREGTVGTGVIEAVALDDLVRGNWESYNELKGHFGTLKFSTEIVAPTYRTLLEQRQFQPLEMVVKETQVPIPPELCQAAYESLISDAAADTGIPVERIARIQYLRNLSGIAPQHTAAVRTSLKTFIGHVAPKDVELLDQLFGISTDKVLTRDLQRQLLSVDNIATFSVLYGKAAAKLPKKEILQKYEQWDPKQSAEGSLPAADSHPRTELIEQLINGTGIIPPLRTLQGVYDMLLTSEAPKLRIDTLAERTGTTPRYSDSAIEASWNSWGQMSVRNASRYFDLLRQSGRKIDPKRIQAIALRHLRDSDRYAHPFAERMHAVEELCAEYGVPMPEETPALQLYHHSRDLERTIGQALNPWFDRGRIHAKGEYGALKKTVRQAVTEIGGEMQQLRRRHPDAEFTDTSPIEHAYAALLRFALLQAERDEKHIVPLGKLVEASGVSIPQQVVEHAVRTRTTDGLYCSHGTKLGYRVEEAP